MLRCALAKLMSLVSRNTMKIIRRAFASTCLSVFLLTSLQTSYAGTTTPAPATKPTIVIVHGAWGGSWAFRQVDALLREKGFNVYRPQLTGLGERVHLSRPDIGLSTHIDDVVNTILYEDLHDITLVGHSYGGMVITGVADRVPDRIRRLIYVDAFVPNDGESVMNFARSRSDWLKPMIKGDYIVPMWVKPDYSSQRITMHNGRHQRLWWKCWPAFAKGIRFPVTHKSAFSSRAARAKKTCEHYCLT